MPTNSIDQASGSLPCGASDAGNTCRYVTAVSTLERLAGFEKSAGFFAAVARRCAEAGCWAKEEQVRPPKSPNPPTVISFQTKLTRSVPAARAGQDGWTGAQAIPLSRSKAIDIISDGAGNRVERRMLGFDSLERQEPLGYLYEYWLWLRNSTSCRFSDLDTAHVMRSGIIGSLHIADVAGADPRDFRYELFGYAIPHAPCDGPSSAPVTIYGEQLIRDYTTVRVTAAPRLQRVRGQIGGMTCHYTRLILPFMDEHRRVSRLAIAVQREVGDGVVIGGQG